MRSLLLIVALLLGAGAHAQELTVLCYHDVRDDVGAEPGRLVPETPNAPILSGGLQSRLDEDQYATSTRNLAAHFDWLRSHGYHVVSLQTVIDARAHRATLPAKPVLITFDDGLRSTYTKVFPLLKVFNYPAVFAVVTSWVDLPKDRSVDFGTRMYSAEDFVTWAQLREMQDGGLIEVVSHSADLHHGVQANPQGNVIPAAVTHMYDPATKTYEDDAAYAARLRADLQASSDAIKEHLGKAPRALMWPYGEFTRSGDDVAVSVGLTTTFSLFGSQKLKPFGTKSDTPDIPRDIMESNPDVSDFAQVLAHTHVTKNVRVVQVDLDYVYDPDADQQERNLSALLDRIKAIGATQVWLQAFADPKGDGNTTEVYFPSKLLPMRADLFSRVAWQLRTRCGVRVFAWLPVISWQLPDRAMQARLQITSRKAGEIENPLRLNPFAAETRKIVGDVYEELARTVPIAGVLFSDDAFLRDTDNLGTGAPPPGSVRTEALIAFTNEMKARVQLWNPHILTARNLFSEPVLQPVSERWYAQSMPAFLRAYDEVGLMAMPDMENVKHQDHWLKHIAEVTARHHAGMEKTVFELQTVDWRTHTPISDDKLTEQMHLLQVHGVQNLGYYPDDFIAGRPDVTKLTEAFSIATTPMRKP